MHKAITIISGALIVCFMSLALATSSLEAGDLDPFKIYSYDYDYEDVGYISKQLHVGHYGQAGMPPMVDMNAQMTTYGYHIGYRYHSWVPKTTAKFQIYFTQGEDLYNRKAIPADIPIKMEFRSEGEGTFYIRKESPGGAILDYGYGDTRRTVDFTIPKDYFGSYMDIYIHASLSLYNEGYDFPIVDAKQFVMDPFFYIDPDWLALPENAQYRDWNVTLWSQSVTIENIDYKVLSNETAPYIQDREIWEMGWNTLTVPEPGFLSLLFAGIVGIGAMIRAVKL